MHRTKAVHEWINLLYYKNHKYTVIDMFRTVAVRPYLSTNTFVSSLVNFRFGRKALVVFV